MGACFSRRQHGTCDAPPALMTADIAEAIQYEAPDGTRRLFSTGAASSILSATAT